MTLHVFGRSAAGVLITALLAFGSAVPARAWNGRGHMLVAAVAWDAMSPATRARAAELLKLNPMYADWVRTAPGGQADRWAFIQAATWPDEIRGKACDLDHNKQNDPLPAGDDGVWAGPMTDFCYWDDGSQPSGTARDDRNIGYRDRLLHRYWHFKDIAFSPDNTPLQAAETPNAGSEIAAYRATLRPGSGATPDAQSYALVWLEHLVGDMHQPLHATSRFTAKTKRGDAGGNSVKVCIKAAYCAKAKAQSLHSFWDGALGSGESVKGIVAAAQTLGAAQAGPSADLEVDHWIDDSFTLAKTHAYVAPVLGGVGRPNGQAYLLDQSYRDTAARVATAQIRLAGARLAGVLEAALN